MTAMMSGRSQPAVRRKKFLGSRASGRSGWAVAALQSPYFRRCSESMGDAAQSQADKFANEAMKRRLKLQQLREEKRKMLLRQMPGYRQSQHEPVEEEERAPSPVTQRERRKTAAAESELPVGFGGGELKPATAKGPGFQVDSKDGDTAKRPLPPKKGGSTGDATEFVTAGVSTPAPPPALTRLQSVQMHERVSQRVEEVQEEIEELEAQVEELMRTSRASRASRRASSANFAGQLPGPRRLTRSSTTGARPRRSRANRPWWMSASSGRSTCRLGCR